MQDVSRITEIMFWVSFPATEGKAVVFPAVQGESNDASLIWHGDH